MMLGRGLEQLHGYKKQLNLKLNLKLKINAHGFKKSSIPTRTVRLIIFSQPSVFIRGHLHAQLEHGWWHRAITIPPRKLRNFAQTPLGYGLYSLFLIFGCFLITFLFYFSASSHKVLN